MKVKRLLNDEWQAVETSTHQHHVIAHVLGATVLGHFVHDETLHLLLDIGFIWTMYLDGQMVLLPHPLAITELQMDDDAIAAIRRDVDLLLAYPGIQHELTWLTQINIEIVEINLYARGDLLRFVLLGVDESLEITTSVSSRTIAVQIINNNG
jgi:hypothetical protein